jgi:neutral ceramidase
MGHPKGLSPSMPPKVLRENPDRLKAGAAVIEITPPLEVGFLNSSVRGEWKPFKSVRAPLHARALVLEFGDQQLAIVSLDLLGLTGVTVGGWSQFKRSLSLGASRVFRPENIVITCTHTHNSPESVGVTDLYRTRQFQKWLNELRRRIVQVLTEAHAALRECTISLATTELNGFSLQRRVPTESGIVMSDSLQPIAPELFRRKPIDRRVRSIQVIGVDGSRIATCVHAVCHPVHEMCLPRVSSDFPGEMCRVLRGRADIGIPFFFNGAAGDINPPTVSGGDRTAALHGRALAKAVMASVPHSQVVKAENVRFIQRTIHLPMRSANGRPARRVCNAHLSALRLGNLAIAFLPGEIFSETALAVEAASPFAKTLVVGFSESSIGYVPPRHLFEEGGYEIGPGRWSFLQEGAEAMLRHEAVTLLNEDSLS